MNVEAIIYFGLCLAAVAFAAHAPAGDRLRAVLLALGLVLNWLFVAWTYAPVSPQSLIRSAGLPIATVDLWAIADLALGAWAVRVGWRHWWGWTVFAFCICHLCMHPMRPLLGDALYTFWLDKILLAQVAVFILIGGRKVANRLSNSARLHRLGGIAQGLFAKVARS